MDRTLSSDEVGSRAEGSASQEARFHRQPRKVFPAALLFKLKGTISPPVLRSVLLDFQVSALTEDVTATRMCLGLAPTGRRGVPGEPVPLPAGRRVGGHVSDRGALSPVSTAAHWWTAEIQHHSL